MYNSQLELEQEMSKTGAERARSIIKKNNEKGRASFNPTTKGIFRQYVQPLADRIKEDKASKKPGARKAYLKFLVGCEEETFAYLAVREMLATLLQNTELNNGRDLCRQLGKVIQFEQIFHQYKQADFKDYIKIIKMLEDKHSLDLEFRTRIARERLVDRYDIAPIEWGTKNGEQVGAYLIQCLVDLGMLNKEIKKVKKNRKVYTYYTISLSEVTLEYLEKAENIFEDFQPLYMPMIEKPMPWKRNEVGGYHTPKLQAVFSSPFLGQYKKGTEDNILEAMNTLQDVAWQVNKEVLEVAIDSSKRRDFSEIVGPNAFIKPEFPTSIKDKKKVDFTEEDKLIMRKWKDEMREYYTETKRRVQKRSRMVMAFNVAKKFKDEREFYFMYQADFRGRMYARSMGISPQGSDLQKALIKFAEGKKLDSQEAIDWFLIHGANKAGIDKVSFKQRIEWVNENHQNIMDTAENPMDVDWWKEQDSPFQFLAWCFEYAEFKKYGEKVFVSYIPIGMDGSCNGLQHYSAAFRDEVGAKATNLVNDVKPNDIYLDVAEVATRLLNEAEEDDRGFRSKWLAHSIKRALVKRSVMTLPYGSTMFSCKDFIYKDYVKDVCPIEFDKKEYQPASNFLGGFTWKAIGEVVIKAREAMKWLQECAPLIVKKDGFIEWETPSGFVVKQVYQDFEQDQRIELALFNSKVVLYKKSDKPNVRRHRNGIAPNFIHSLDSSHMQAVALRCKKEGIKSFAMVHDDFGTHASDAVKFNKIIREEFYNMYLTDWFDKFYQKYKSYGIPEPPSKGNLDIKEVLTSDYFFC